MGTQTGAKQVVEQVAERVVEQGRTGRTQDWKLGQLPSLLLYLQPRPLGPEQAKGMLPTD